MSDSEMKKDRENLPEEKLEDVNGGVVRPYTGLTFVMGRWAPGIAKKRGRVARRDHGVKNRGIPINRTSV